MLLELNNLIRFEGYALNRPGWSLQWQGEPIALSRKSFDVLLYLIDQRDRVVSKGELLKSIWADQFVEESNLTQHVFLLRKALSRHESGSTIIQTVPGRGYRFAAQIQAEPGVESGEQLEPQVELSPAPPLPGSTDEKEETEAPLAVPADRAHEISLPTRPAANPPQAARLRTLASAASSPTVRGTLLLAVLAVIFGLYVAIRWKDPPHLSVTTYTQITHDGRAKSIGGTDGSRLYFTQLESSSVAEVSVSGGAVAPIPLPIQEQWSGKVSPDGSTLLLISQARGQGPATSLWSYRLVGGSLHRLGNAVSSAWSPDGTRIVYATANGEIAVMQRDGSEAHRIATPGGNLESIAWSPRGDSIRFSRDGLLWETTSEGANPHQLLPGWGNSATQSSGEWSGDGNYVFAADGQIWALEESSFFGLKRRTSPVQLTFGPTRWDRPIFSLDGKKILASGRTERGELVRYDEKSTQFKPLLGGISAEFASYSNDGKSVAYVSYPEGVLWRANVDGSNPAQLTEPPVYAKSACWSPDGAQIAFVDRTVDGADAIYVVAADGNGKPQRILPQDSQAETDPSWSPDGRKIAFSTSPNVGASAKSDLRIFDFSTRTAAVIPASDGLLVPRWSPDGRLIAAMTLDTVKLRVVDLSSQKWSTLDTGAVAFPEWSRDGRWIYFVRWTADPAVLRIHLADGSKETVASLQGARYTGTYTLWMGLDGVDAPMMLRDEGKDDIYALTLERK